MNAGNVALGMDVTMQYSDITKSYQPFWPGFEFRPVDFIYDTQRPISAPGTHDSFDLWIIEHLLEVVKSFFIGATESEVFFSYRVACLHLITPALHDGE